MRQTKATVVNCRRCRRKKIHQRNSKTKKSVQCTIWLFRDLILNSGHSFGPSCVTLSSSKESGFFQPKDSSVLDSFRAESVTNSEQWPPWLRGFQLNKIHWVWCFRRKKVYERIRRSGFGYAVYTGFMITLFPMQWCLSVVCSYGVLKRARLGVMKLSEHVFHAYLMWSMSRFEKNNKET